jgi:uncharacterized protein DUF3309
VRFICSIARRDFLKRSRFLFPELPGHARVARQGLDRSEDTMLGTILIIVLILLLIGALPTWPYSNGWGYYPGGGLGLILVIVIVLVLIGRI